MEQTQDIFLSSKCQLRAHLEDKVKIIYTFEVDSVLSSHCKYLRRHLEDSITINSHFKPTWSCLRRKFFPPNFQFCYFYFVFV